MTLEEQFAAMLGMVYGPPRRVQRLRAKGFRLPPNTICVTRPGPWGNPYFAGAFVGFGYFDEQGNACSYDLRDPATCVHCFYLEMRQMKSLQPERYRGYLAPLRGRNLACWCGDGDSCHADVLLRIANE